MTRFNLLIICTLYINISFAQQADNSHIKILLKEKKYDQALSLLEKQSQRDIETLLLKGDIYLQIGRLNDAEIALLKALQIGEDAIPVNDEKLAETYNGLALVYWNSGQDSEAEKFMLRAIDIRHRINKGNTEMMAASFNDLGLITARTNPDNALINYEKALTIYRNQYGATSERVAQGLINTGIIFRETEMYGEASNNFSEALKIMKGIYSGAHPTIAFIETNSGRVYEAMGLLPSAEASYKKAMLIYQEIYGNKHPEIANLNILLGQLNLKKFEYQTALQYFQNSLIANSRDFTSEDLSDNPLQDDYYHPYTFLTSLLNKSRAFQRLHYNKTLKYKHLKEALTTLEISDSLINKLRYAASNENDKLSLGSIASEIYDDAVNLTIQMADVSLEKKKYYEKAYYFLERSKASVLQQAINATNAKQFSGLPEDILKEESELLYKIGFFTQKLKEKPADIEEAELRSELLDLENKHKNLIVTLETKYPDYYNLKYKKSEISIQEVQKHLNQESAVLNYFISESNSKLHVFLITNKNFRVYSYPITEDFNRYISGLRNSLYFRDQNTFLMTSSALGELLIPNIPGNINHLVIIPTGRLNSIPFEVLLTSQAEQGNKYSTLPFLIKKYSTGYAYSSSLHFSPKNKSAEGENVFIAPVTFNYKNDLNLPTLPGTETECTNITENLKGRDLNYTLLLKDDAGENEFKKINGKPIHILHLATHGVIDEARPDQSRIYFTEGNDDGRLYTGELYNIKLNADLITLSACETGLGKVSKGEGVLGFTRALLYSGANNVVVSLWSVQDSSTSDLMVDFYNSYFDSNSYALGLRESKLKMIQGSEFADPFYWAPFILIGE